MRSCVLLFMSLNHDEALGPKSTHARLRDEKAMSDHDVEANPPQPNETVQSPAPIHQIDGATDAETSKAPPAAEHMPHEVQR